MLLTDEVRQWLGRERSYVAPEAFNGAEFRYFAMAIGDDNPRWRQGEAPPTFVCESAQYLDSIEGLLEGGHHWDLPIENCRQIRGGHEYEFHRAVRTNDRLHVTWQIVDMSEKRSSAGTDMLFVISEATYRDQAGELLATNRETIIYQAIG